MTDTALTISRELATILNGMYAQGRALNADFTVDPYRLADFLRRYINEEVSERVKVAEAICFKDGARYATKSIDDKISRLENALRRLVLCADQPGEERDAAISEGWKLIYGPR